MVELVEDNYREIYGWIERDYKTTASWFLCCKLFHCMVTPETIRRYSSPPILLQCMRRYDGLLSGLASFRGKQCVVWISQWNDHVEPANYPQEVWDVILNYTSDEYDELETNDHDIFIGDFDLMGRLQWFVSYKRTYKLYTRDNFDPANVNWKWLEANHFETDYQCMGEFRLRDFDSTLGIY
jgi:hypothetical protein